MLYVVIILAIDLIDALLAEFNRFNMCAYSLNYITVYIRSNLDRKKRAAYFLLL